LFGRVAAFKRQCEKRSIQLEVPRMVGAAQEPARVAVRLVEHHHALVRAAVVQHADAGIGLADHDHRLIAHGGGEKIPGLGYLAGVAHVDPGVGKEVFHFKLEDLFVYEEITMHLRCTYQRGNRVGPVAVAMFGVHGAVSCE